MRLHIESEKSSRTSSVRVIYIFVYICTYTWYIKNATLGWDRSRKSKRRTQHVHVRILCDTSLWKYIESLHSLSFSSSAYTALFVLYIYIFTHRYTYIHTTWLRYSAYAVCGLFALSIITSIKAICCLKKINIFGWIV